MGCDIHDLVQIKRDKKWKTVTLDPVGSPRCYNTFAMLAGVRNGDKIKPVAEPRGLPEDLGHEIDGDHKFLVGINSEIDVKDAYLGDDSSFWLGDHSHSWLTLAEMKAYKKPEVIYDYWDDLIKELENIANENEAPDDEVRYVFGFDN
jgi:hypothetical protein